jgi:hypothetical protein
MEVTNPDLASAASATRATRTSIAVTVHHRRPDPSDLHPSMSTDYARTQPGLARHASLPRRVSLAAVNAAAAPSGHAG